MKRYIWQGLSGKVHSFQLPSIEATEIVPPLPEKQFKLFIILIISLFVYLALKSLCRLFFQQIHVSLKVSLKAIVLNENTFLDSSASLGIVI